MTMSVDPQGGRRMPGRAALLATMSCAHLQHSERLCRGTPDVVVRRSRLPADFPHFGLCQPERAGPADCLSLQITGTAEPDFDHLRTPTSIPEGSVGGPACRPPSDTLRPPRRDGTRFSQGSHRPIRSGLRGRQGTYRFGGARRRARGTARRSCRPMSPFRSTFRREGHPI